MQSHVTNLRVTLEYADGATQPVDLVNPFTIGDCWSCCHYHDTAANGFENIGGRFGPAGLSEAGDLTKPIHVDCEAHLVPFDLKQGTELKSIRCKSSVLRESSPFIGSAGASPSRDERGGRARLPPSRNSSRRTELIHRQLQVPFGFALCYDGCAVCQVPLVTVQGVRPGVI